MLSPDTPVRCYVRTPDLIDIFERVLTEAGMFEICIDAVDDNEVVWLRLPSIGVEILTYRPNSSWHRLFSANSADIRPPRLPYLQRFPL